jgi:hypothetical protein
VSQLDVSNTGSKMQPDSRMQNRIVKLNRFVIVSAPQSLFHATPEAFSTNGSLDLGYQQRVEHAADCASLLNRLLTTFGAQADAPALPQFSRTGGSDEPARGHGRR